MDDEQLSQPAQLPLSLPSICGGAMGAGGAHHGAFDEGSRMSAVVGSAVMSVVASEDDPLMQSYYPAMPAWLSAPMTPREDQPAPPTAAAQTAAAAAAAAAINRRGATSGGAACGGGARLDKISTSSPEIGGRSAGDAREILSALKLSMPTTAPGGLSAHNGGAPPPPAEVSPRRGSLRASASASATLPPSASSARADASARDGASSERRATGGASAAVPGAVSGAERYTARPPAATARVGSGTANGRPSTAQGGAPAAGGGTGGAGAVSGIPRAASNPRPRPSTADVERERRGGGKQHL
jgi:hypothetical protein